jgi:hypothetical protein
MISLRDRSSPVSTLPHLMHYRGLILACECACLLHDIGKLSSRFIRSKACDCHEPDRHAQILELDREWIPQPCKDFLQTPLAYFWPKVELAFPWGEVHLADFIRWHHGGNRQNHFPREVLPFARLLQACDRKSSAEDKANPSDRAKQLYAATYYSSLFGREARIDPEKLDARRLQLWHKLGAVLSAQSIDQTRQKMLSLLKPVCRSSLAETRRAANDIDLFLHSFSMAGYFKASLVSFLCGMELPQEVEQVSRRILCLRHAGGIQLILADLQRLLERQLAVGNLIFADVGQAWFLIGGSDAIELELAQQLGSRWPQLQLVWVDGDALEVPTWSLDPVSLMVQPGQNGVYLGARLFLQQDAFTTLWAKQVEQIEPGLNCVGLVSRTRQVLALASAEEAHRVEERIASLQRHLMNLRRAAQKGKLSALKTRELAEKRHQIQEMKRDVQRLLRGADWRNALQPGESAEEARRYLYLFIDQVFSWMHSPDPLQIAWRWRSRNQAAPWIALYSILAKSASLSRLLALMEEGSAFMRSLERRLGKASYRTPFFACFPVPLERLEAEVQRLFDRRFGKMRGRLPWRVIPSGEWGEDALFCRMLRKVKAVKRSSRTLQITFQQGEPWCLPILLGGRTLDRFYLHGWIRRPRIIGERAKDGLVLGDCMILPLDKLYPGDRLISWESS